VVRIIGYDSVPTTMLSTPIPKHQPDPMRSLKDEVRELLVGCGMQEAITYTLTSKAILDRVSQSPDNPKPMRVSNPMSAEQECLRTTLRGGLLSALAANERYQEGDIRLFEVGRIYLPQGQELPLEREVLGGVISCGSVTLKDLFFQIKGVVELLFHRLGGDVTFEIGEDPLLHPGRSAVIILQGTHLGIVGEVHPRVLEAFDIGSPGVGLFELDLEGLLSHITLAKKYQPVSRYPSLMRDIALVLDEGVPAKEVQEIMKSLSLVKDATLFDIYTGEQIPSGKKSLAYRIEYHSPARTLTDEEVNKVQAKLVKRLNKELGATLRG
ncbi:MAG: phenylalanine--tRNA ligase subunit beta, partial [Dehalococcoidia bacterium]